MTKSSGAARQARQREKGRQVAVILPPPAAEALDEIQKRRECTQAQAISMALHLMLAWLDAPSKAC